MTFCHHGILVPKMLFFGHFGGLSQTRENQPVGPNGLAREAILPFWHQAGYLAGGLVAWWHTALRPLGLAICIFEGLGTVDVKMHGFKVAKSAYFDGVLCCYVAM